MHAAAILLVTLTQLLSHLSGTWRAPEERTPRDNALDQRVFGPGAMDVRAITLTITPDGNGDLQIRRSVVGRTGKVFAPSVTDVKIHIADPITLEFGQLHPTTIVTSAEERYLDGARERWPRDGSKVSLSTIDLTSKELNIQFDTPDGRGAFGATLARSSSVTGFSHGF